MFEMHPNLIAYHYLFWHKTNTLFLADIIVKWLPRCYKLSSHARLAWCQFVLVFYTDTVINNWFVNLKMQILRYRNQERFSVKEIMKCLPQETVREWWTHLVRWENQDSNLSVEI